ncbi:MAG: Lrp/AsnC family transcriptional regulator [Candidatus Thorarchaeota archaeon]|nr:Lrp/AsnC family transcriptional regulator [Candidatus Thorarchaeota archaeon]
MAPSEKIDKYDRKIIELLSEDARSSLRDIGKKVKLSASSVRNRMARLVEIGVIKSYTLDVDWRKVGYDIQVLLLISSWSSSVKEIYNTLIEQDEILQVFWTSGPANLVCLLRVRDMNELSQFITEKLDRIRGIQKVETMFLMPSPH